MAEKSKKPSGLKLTRKKNTFTASWKQPKGGYEKQTVEYRILVVKSRKTNKKKQNTDSVETLIPKKGEWKTLTNSTSIKKKSFTVKKDNFFPYSGKKELGYVEFRVKGKQKSKTESEWSAEPFEPKKPPAPKVTTTALTWPKTKFAWEVNASDTDKRWFTRVQYQSVLKYNIGVAANKLTEDEWTTTYPGSTKYDAYGDIDSTSGNIQPLEDSEIFDADDGKASFTRYFRIRSLGPKGVSKWVYGRQIYAKPMDPVVALTATTIDEVSNKYFVQVWFHSYEDNTHPVKDYKIKYAITTFGENLTFPSGSTISSEAKTVITKNKDETSYASFDISPLCAPDQGLFIQIQANYDDSVSTSGPIALVYGGFKKISSVRIRTDETTGFIRTTYDRTSSPDYSLKSPSAPETTTHIIEGADYNTVEFRSTNASEVPGSKLIAVYYNASDSNYRDGFVLGEVTSGVSTTLQCPKWNSGDEIYFGAYATASNENNTITVVSETVKQTVPLPTAPEITANRADTAGTIRVTWNWVWDRADSAEVSWADHKDAWESTDEPNTYIVSKSRNSALNISGLETGIKWYIRVRLISGNDDEVSYGEYSDIKEVMLSTAPIVPTLSISPEVATEDQSATISWVYFTTDGSNQGSAKIHEVIDGVISDNAIKGGEIEGSAQSMTIVPSDLGWANGEDHTLVVQTVSESGWPSEDWSAPATLHVAAKPNITINDTSLEWGNVKVNPRTYTGDIVTFETDMEETFTELSTALEPIQDTHGYDSAWIHNDNEQEPYIQRAIAGTVTDMGNYIYDTVVGGTVAWNQLNRDNASKNHNGVTFSNDGNGKFTVSGTPTARAYSYTDNPSMYMVSSGHVLLSYINIVSGTVPSGVVFGGSFYNGSTYKSGWGGANKYVNMFKVPNDCDRLYYTLVDITQSVVTALSGGSVNFSIKANLFDLTQMFGTAIADYIYNLEQATAGAGIAWFRNLFPKSYYAYDAGSLQSVNTSSHVLMSKNMLVYPYRQSSVTVNGVAATANSNGTVTVNGTCTEGGSYMWLYGSAGTSLMPTLNEGETYIYSLEGAVNGLNGQVVFYGSPSVVHYITGGNNDKTTTFTVPDMSGYNGFAVVLAFVNGFTYNNVTVKPMIRLASISDSTYEPYSATPYPLDSSLTLRGIPKLDSNNKLYYDGDTYESSGTVTRNWAEVTPSANDWYLSQTTGFTYSLPNNYDSNKIRAMTVVTGYDRFIGGWDSIGDKQFQALNGSVGLRDSTYADITAWRSHITNNPVSILYPITPTTETATGFTNPQLIDGKTVEQYTDYAVSQGTRDVAIPVGHQTDHANICPIYGRTGQTVTVTGKNQIGTGVPVVNGYLVQLGDGYVAGGRTRIGASNDNRTAIVPVMPNTTYTYKWNRETITGTDDSNVALFDEYPTIGVTIGTFTGANIGAGSTRTFTTGASTRYAAIKIANVTKTNPTTTLENSQLEFGSTATAWEPYAGATYTREFEDSQGNTLTVYGGEDEIVGGVLTVTKIAYDGGDISWSKITGNNYRNFYWRSDPIAKYSSYTPMVISSVYKSVANNSAYADDDNYVWIRMNSATNIEVAVKDTSKAGLTAAEFKTAMTGIQFVYDLETPITHQLTPNEVTTLIGTNHVWSDAGEVTVDLADVVEEGYLLTEMPLTVTVADAGDNDDVTVMVERSSFYRVDRPDETNLDGYENEIVLADTRTGNGTITFDTKDLIGRLDDGAPYRIVATVEDNYGQSNTTYDPEDGDYTWEFVVRWDHQAEVPTVYTEIDTDNEIAILIPLYPISNTDDETNILTYSSKSNFPAEGQSRKLYVAEDTNAMYWWEDSQYVENTDTCDIYRLSVDKPILIYKGAQFGQVYVDPYPTIGEYGGHRFVTVTANGDYTVGDVSDTGQFAWTDTGAEENDIFETHSNIIDFGNDKVHLLYEVDLSNNWSKDFKETKYLGGSIQGDWNPAVSRTGSLNVTTVSDLDQETIQSMRRLAVYPGICHVRTKDGSSYSANVDVDETYKYTRAPRFNEYSLSITRVDPEALDGMTYLEWIGEDV